MDLLGIINQNRSKKEKLEKRVSELVEDKERMLIIYNEEIKRLQDDIKAIDTENEALAGELEYELKENSKFNKKYSEHLKTSPKTKYIKK